LEGSLSVLRLHKDIRDPWCLKEVLHLLTSNAFGAETECRWLIYSRKYNALYKNRQVVDLPIF
jgi:hypothetical protein